MQPKFVHLGKAQRRRNRKISQVVCEVLEDRTLFSALTATTTTLTDSPASSTYGASVRLTATVKAKSGSPTGTVTFMDGTATIGSAHITASTHQAVLNTTALPLGSDSITASYAGAGTFASSASVAVTENVAPADPTVTVASSANPAKSGQSVTLTATVTAPSGSPSGSVTFLDGTTTLGSAPINTSTHKATLATTSLPVGPNSIKAVYGGAAPFGAASSIAFTETITAPAAATTTTLASSLNPAASGQAVTLTATVAAASGSPTGTVTFLDGTRTLGIAAVSTTTHKASLVSTTLATGANNITAVYSGASAFVGSSSAALTETITPPVAATITALASSLNPAPAGQAVTLTATVTSTKGSPTGSVTFLDGTTTLGTASVNSTTHKASFVDSSLSSGANSLKAAYTGTAGFAASSSLAFNETITAPPAATVTTLAPSVNPAITGQTVTLTATVTAASGSPSGTVIFLDGTTTLGTASVNSTTHQASFATAALATGSNTISAVYRGSSAFATSSSIPVSVPVNIPATTTTLAAAPNPATAGQAVTLTATVTASSGSPSGTVTFLNGTTTLGMESINTTTHTASLVTTTLATGANSITAVYGGTPAFASSSSAAIVETVNAISNPTDQTVLTLSTTNATIGQSVTLTATVTPSGSTAVTTGTVTFTTGTTTLGTATVNSSGVATFSEYSLYTGTYNITATYSGNSTYPISSGSNTLKISLPTFTSPTTGLQLATITPGSGTAVKSGEFVTVDYTGYIYDPGQSDDGTKFDSSLNPGRTPFQFWLGEGAVIGGWDDGIPGMLNGETRVLLIQPALAYGASGQGSIPGNATLLFIVHLFTESTPPRLNVFGGASLTTPVTLNESPTSANGTAFGNITVGSTSAASLFGLQNSDTSFNLSLTSVTSSNPGEFILENPPTGSSASFQIVFKPSAKGLQTSTITVVTNDPNVPNYTFTVNGTGT